MMMAATLSNAGRATHRIPTARPATLRDAQRQPIDILIENLSADGFGMSTTTSLSRGERVSLQLAGIDPREARVVRRLGLSYGCEFLVPLDMRELATALDAGTVLNGRFPADAETMPTDRDEAHVSRLGRIGILMCVNVLLWTAIILTLRTLL
ncbi:MAG: pilus assembly protein PilZ [Oxalobacteraceae bacterium]|nr:MAG: pilus assembly protein PilZ [Oxalobacteraceae bacterium]